MSRIAGALLVLLLAACARPPVAPSVHVQTGAVRLWQDASIFQEVAHLIGGASDRVLVEMYELGRSDIVTALAISQRRAVDVRVITDPTVTQSRHSAARLDQLGVPERAYPVDDNVHQIDHVKLLVADGIGFVGGMNWGTHSDRNHDFVLETHRAVDVVRLAAIFEQDWSRSSGRPAPLRAASGSIAQTAPGHEIRAMLEDAIGRARRHVLAEVFTLTDPEILAGLAAAHRRGADVRALLDPNQSYNRHAYSLLSSAGVPVRWYPVPKGALLHAKSGLFDGELILGSANWTRSGLGTNHELDIATEDAQAVAAFAMRFETDWARSA